MYLIRELFALEESVPSQIQHRHRVALVAHRDAVTTRAPRKANIVSQ